MNYFDLCRKNLHDRLQIHGDKKRDLVKMEAEIHSMIAMLEEISNLARPRLIMGGIRYGSDWTHAPLMDYMQEKFDTYKATGNFEMLIDFFNFIIVEGQLKTHPTYHFSEVDRK